MKIIKYSICTKVSQETENGPELVDVLSSVVMGWNEANEAIAAKEAYNGEYTIEDDGTEESTEATWQDTIEAQVTYTAMMTDTLLEV